MGVGASEVAAVMGLAPYRSPLGVYESKVKEGPGDDLSSVEAVEWGNTLEPVIASIYGKRISEGDPLATYTLRESPTLIGEESWELATPDRIITRITRDGDHGDLEEHFGLEIKVRSRMSREWGPDGSDQVPVDVYYQCLWGMWVTGLRRWDVAALFFGTELRIYHLQWDAELAELARTEVADFWNNHVLPRVPPLARGTDNDKMAHYHPAADEDVLEVGLLPEAEQLHETAALLHVTKARIKELEVERDECEVILKEAVGAHLGLSSGDWSVKWSPVQGKSKTDWQAIAAEMSMMRDDDGKALDSLLVNHTELASHSRRFTFKHNGGE